MVVSKPLLTLSAAAIQTIQDVMQPVTASLSKYLWEQNFAVQIFMCWYLIAKKKCENLYLMKFPAHDFVSDFPFFP